MSKLGGSADALLRLWAHDPHKVRPADFDFTLKPEKAGASRKEKKVKKQRKSETELREGDDGDDGAVSSPTLQRRVMIEDFSNTIGWRPTGVQKGQQEMLEKRCVTDFVRSAMPKVVLPCSRDPMQFCTEENQLPCPNLALYNAIRNIQKKGLAKGRAEEEMAHITSNGVQVEWMVVETFPQWCAYMEAGHLNSELTSRPHLVETALSYLGWKQTAPTDGTADGDEGFLQMMGQNLGKRRLTDVKTLINGTSGKALELVVAFRRQADCVYANLFAESYLMSPQFRALPEDAQASVTKAAIKRVKETPINWKSAVPRPVRSTFSITHFHALCSGGPEIF